MSLTRKLILGFLFALALQIGQMLISGYFTASMRDRSEMVSDALQAHMAAQHSLDVVRELQNRIARVVHGSEEPRLPVYEVYLSELMTQVEKLTKEAFTHVPIYTERIQTAIKAVNEQMRGVRAAKRAGDAQAVADALAFLDDALSAVVEPLQQAQVELGHIGEESVAAERRERHLPLQAGLAITVTGVVIMAAFVVWFSRQLVAPIEVAWAQLETRVAERTAELATTVEALERQVDERKRVEAQREDLHRQLVDASRQAGMAELANGVLHNVGNVLNSVNVSARVLHERVRRSRADGLGKAVGLLRQHEHDLADYLTSSQQGQKLVVYLDQLASHLSADSAALLAETNDLSSYIDQMKEIVHRQQAYARVSGTTSVVRLSDLIVDVIRMHESSYERHEIVIKQRIEHDLTCEIDRSRLMQILVNLIKNAKQAIVAARRSGGKVEIALLGRGDDTVVIQVSDNGIGIAAENLTRVFGHGFTTKVNGHGFGLHHSANSATEMGGRLWAESDGLDKGATFVLELPVPAAAEAVS